MRIVFFGTPDFSVPSLKALLAIPSVTVCLVVTQPDRPAGRGSELRMSPVKKEAIAHSIPVLQPTSLRKDVAALEQLRSYGPYDIGVVIAFGQILPQTVLDLPSHGCVNVHASLLPRWRGAAPIQRAILAGDTETGICLMKMDAGLDTGAVYCRESVPIHPTDTAGKLHDLLAAVGAQLLGRSIEDICCQKLIAQSQPENGVTYAHKVEVAEAHLDWSKSALELARVVRAFSPFPGAFTSLQGKRLKVLGASPRTSHGSASPPPLPGTVTFIGKERIEVACGEGELLLEDIQLEGKRRMAIGEFLRGYPLTVNTVLEPISR